MEYIIIERPLELELWEIAPAVFIEDTVIIAVVDYVVCYSVSRCAVA